MTGEKPTNALKKARETFESKERARFGGYTGRVHHDKRAPGSHVVDLHIGLDEIGPNNLKIKEKLPKTWLNHVLKAFQENPETPNWEMAEDGLLDITLHRETNLVQMDGQLEVAMTRACDRCLLPIVLDLSQRWQLHFLPAPLNPEIDLNLGLGDVGEAHAHLPLSEDVESGPDTFFYEGGLIDLQSALCEEIFLNLPAYLRCDHGKVRQVPNGCQKTNEEGSWTPKDQESWSDPRWADLAQLRGKLAPGPDEPQ